MLHSSQPVNITVQGSRESSLAVIVMAVVAVMVAVAVGGAAVGWFRLRKKKISANVTGAEEADKIEAEHTITYSLLMHPEAPEDETEPPDYQNI